MGTTEHLSEADYARWTRRVEPQAGDVVFSYETRLGEAAIIPTALRCCLGRRMGLLRPRPDKIDERFLLYAYLGPKFQETLRSRTIPGSTVDRIPLIAMPEFPIKIPSTLDEQRAIAGVLGALDDKIEQNHRTSQALERLARAIFRAWFVDFEPVKAKAEGATSFPSMPQPVFDALPTRFVDSEIGPLPEGWEVKAVSVAFEVNPSRPLRKGALAPYLDMKNMPTDGHAPAAWTDRPFGSGMRFMNGDTLVARITPCLENGKTAFVDFLGDGQTAWGSTEYIVLRPRAPLPPIVAYCLARTVEFRDYAVQNMSGTSGRQRVAPTAMDHYRIAVPSDDVAGAFGDAVNPMFDQIRAGMDESRKLAEMRDYLLPKLLCGQVGVRQAERADEEVA
ncbi:MAG: restriction endonuclease subunit S [Chloroflexia bacterium]|nr:restriction endonuclease subunit S [Chloroflexia bacterium]